MTGTERAAALVAKAGAPWDPARTERALTGLHQRRRVRRIRAAALGLAAVAALALLALGWPRTEPTVATSPGTASTSDPSPNDRVELADGSIVDPADGAHVVVERVEPASVVVRLDAGAAHFEVTPRPARAFEVRVGVVTVTVLGTAFVVTRTADDHARVAVEHGRVRVAWPAGEAILVDGDAAIFPPIAAPEGVLAASPTTLDPAPEREVAPPLPTAAPPARETGWRELARDERYDDAYAVLGAADVGDRVEDLLLAADVARLSGHAADALPYLDRVLADHATDGRAGLASMTRGRILSTLGRHAEAADAFERALALEPGGSFAEDALARAALARASSGDSVAARALAARYATAHPDGRWTARLAAIGDDGE